MNGWKTIVGGIISLIVFALNAVGKYEAAGVIADSATDIAGYIGSLILLVGILHKLLKAFRAKSATGVFHPGGFVKAKLLLAVTMIGLLCTPLLALPPALQTEPPPVSKPKLQITPSEFGAGIEASLKSIGEPVVIFRPCLTWEPVGLQYPVKNQIVQYLRLSALVATNSVSQTPHLGAALHLGGWVTVGCAWGERSSWAYCSSEEFVETTFWLLGQAIEIL